MSTKTSLHPPKVGVWCAMSRRRIVGPFFFSITGEAYRKIIFQFVANLNKDEVRSWFQQDNARPHIAVETMESLRSFFGDRLISANLCLLRSPDLSPLDSFMWGYLKDRVYHTAPTTLIELQTRIVEEINKIYHQMLERVFSNLIKRAQLCKDANGLQFQHLL